MLFDQQYYNGMFGLRFSIIDQEQHSDPPRAASVVLQLHPGPAGVAEAHGEVGEGPVGEEGREADGHRVVDALRHEACRVDVLVVAAGVPA